MSFTAGSLLAPRPDNAKQRRTWENKEANANGARWAGDKVGDAAEAVADLADEAIDKVADLADEAKDAVVDGVKHVASKLNPFD